jgi:hypothetical protein
VTESDPLGGTNLGTGAATFLGESGIGGNTTIAPPLLGLTVTAPIPSRRPMR